MRAKPWELRGFRLPNGLRVVHVTHPHLDDGTAVTLTVPVGSRRAPHGAGAFVATHLGVDPHPELGHTTLRWTLAGALDVSLDRVHAAITAPCPDAESAARRWGLVQTWAAAVRDAPAVVALNAAHHAAFPKDASYLAPWPAPVGPAPPLDDLAQAWRRLDSRVSHLVVADRRPSAEVERLVRAHPVGQRTVLRSRIRREERPTAIREATAVTYRHPVRAPSGAPGILAGIVVPVRGSQGGDYLLPYLARLPMPEGLHSSVWPHVTASVWAVWGVVDAATGVGGSALLRAAAEVYRGVALRRIETDVSRRLGYSLEGDLRRIAQSPALLAHHVAGLQGLDAPPSPPTPPFNPVGFAGRLQRLAFGVGEARTVVAGENAVDRPEATRLQRELARDRAAVPREANGRDRPHRVPEVRPHPRPGPDPAG